MRSDIIIFSFIILTLVLFFLVTYYLNQLDYNQSISSNSIVEPVKKMPTIFDNCTPRLRNRDNVVIFDQSECGHYFKAKGKISTLIVELTDQTVLKNLPSPTKKTIFEELNNSQPERDFQFCYPSTNPI